MINYNPIDDGQTKSGPLFARRDVWLQQAVACVLWKSGTIVFDGDINALVGIREHNSNLATHLSLFRHALDRLCSVLEQIAQRLTDQAFVAKIGDLFKL